MTVEDQNQRTRDLLSEILETADKAVAKATAILATGRGVRFIITIHDEQHTSAQAEQLDKE